MNWHNFSIHQIYDKLKTSEQGLSTEEADKRLSEYGKNILVEKQRKKPIVIFLGQFTDFLIIILIISAIVSAIVGELNDSLPIVFIVIINAIIGFIQEYRAEKAMEALKKMATPNCTILRDGKHINISSEELVPGDMVFLEAGNISPADLRLIESINLKSNESALTGESEEVVKFTKEIELSDIPLGDRKNMIYSGTSITYGRGAGIVVNTGMKTELGKIASMIQTDKELKTPLQIRLITFGKKLSIAIFIICIVFFLAGTFRGEALKDMFLTAVSLAVAAIPEALPAVITIALALGAKKLVRKNVLIRKLSAVETLGSVTYICSDKTGTLTINKMTVVDYYVDGKLFSASEKSDNSIENFFEAVSLNNDVKKSAAGDIIGEATEIGLNNFALIHKFDKNIIEQKLPRKYELPFDSDRKCMTTIHKTPDGTFVSYTKGAFDIMLEHIDEVLENGKITVIDKKKLIDINNNFANEGKRVMCFAMKKIKTIPDKIEPVVFERNMVFLGLASLIDPAREEVKDAIALCRTAGIKPVMITGDHPLTAKSIAKSLNMITGDCCVVTGAELEKISDQEFNNEVENIQVYARVAPEQKLKIVKALQNKNHFVAMTGDGVNDAPALKNANIGVAMGITGTAVSKEAAHMILLDDNFATIVNAVKEGRKIFDNIIKYITYTMTCNAGTLWAVFIAPFLGLDILKPVQILWMNLLCDGLPGLSLTSEPAEKDIMNRKPRKTDETIFSNGVGNFILVFGLIIGVIMITFQWFCEKYFSMPKSQSLTIIFTAFIFGRMAVTIASRSLKNSILKMNFFSNMPLIYAIVITVILQLAVIYVPVMNGIFKTEPLSPWQLSLTLIITLIIFVFSEIYKYFIRKEIKKS
ncbi:cation-translocating P-type ATPase [Candidatus Dependentiae bacterium]|nr:cation-translocating P-type ATPase [Candidatus Dependentiae bacterium]